MALLATSGAELTSSGGGGVGCGTSLMEGVALVLSPAPANPCTMLLKPLTPSQIIPSRFSQKRAGSAMFASRIDSRMCLRMGVY